MRPVRTHRRKGVVALSARRPPWHSRIVRVAGSALLLPLVLAACSTTTLRVDPPTPAPDADEACRALHAVLPGSVLEEERREVTPLSELTAAWGDIVLRCGVDEPDALVATSELFSVDGVEWFPEELTKGTRFTSVGRVANVEVDVPDAHRPEADALVDLAPAISDRLPLLD